MDVATLGDQVESVLAAVRALASQITVPGESEAETSGLALPDRAAADAALTVLAELVALGNVVEFLATVTAGAYARWSRQDWLAQVDPEGLLSSAKTRDICADVDSCSAREITLATGVGERVAWQRIELADAFRTDPVRTKTLHAGMSRGSVSAWRAYRVWTTTLEAPADLADRIAASVLAPCRDGSALNQQLLTRRLSYQVAKHCPAGRQRQRELDERGLWASFTPAGTGTVSLSGAAEDIVAAHSRIDGVARSLRAGGDRRTLAQLRSDIALRLLCQGVLPEGGIEYPDGTLRPMAAPKITVTVPLNTLLHGHGQPAHLDGVGWISPALAEELAYRPDSTWTRLLIDPVTGAAVELSSRSYTPPPRMRRFIEFRDVTCRGPGCTVPACRCDLDHGVDYPQGPTSPINVSAKHRPCHNHKTRGWWRADTGNDGAITWTTRSGRTYITHVWNHLDPGPDIEIDWDAMPGHGRRQPSEAEVRRNDPAYDDHSLIERPPRIPACAKVSSHAHGWGRHTDAPPPF